jgi:hypothetical protein
MTMTMTAMTKSITQLILSTAILVMTGSINNSIGVVYGITFIEFKKTGCGGSSYYLDIAGNPNPKTGVDDYLQCEAICAKDSKCVAFESNTGKCFWYKSGFVRQAYDTSSCWEKTNGSNPTEPPSVTPPPPVRIIYKKREKERHMFHTSMNTKYEHPS